MVPHPPGERHDPSLVQHRYLRGIDTIQPWGNGDSAPVQRLHRPGAATAPPWCGGNSFLEGCRASPGEVPPFSQMARPLRRGLRLPQPRGDRPVSRQAPREGSPLHEVAGTSLHSARPWRKAGSKRLPLRTAKNWSSLSLALGPGEAGAILLSGNSPAGGRRTAAAEGDASCNFLIIIVLLLSKGDQP
jgi:hypothetical protein